MVFGILAMISGMTVWFGILFGVMAVVLGILSKVNHGYWDGRAIAGLALGIAGLVISLLMFFLALSMMSNPEFMQQMNDMLEQYQQPTIQYQ
jgi:hypothetical protein